MHILLKDSSASFRYRYFPVGVYIPFKILRVVKQEELLDFFDSVPEISKANILRKGRFLTTPDLVTIVKGRNGFLSDIFKKRDGVDFRRRKVVCREILQCDGRGRCQRACGGLGKCVSGKERHSE